VAAPPRIALVSRDVAPLCGGGIAEYVTTAAAVLGKIGEVTVFTTDLHEEAYERLVERRLAPDIDLVFVEEPRGDDTGGFYSPLHLYSSRVWDALREHYGDDPPALIEFSDYLAEGFVTTQANQAHDPWLRDTTVAIRLHTSAELCSVLDGHYDETFTARITAELERFALAHADALVVAGPATWQTYVDFYGESRLARQVIARYPLAATVGVRSTQVQRPHGAALRLLFLGRMERRKGVHHLVRALQSLDRDDWELTLLGGDTQSGPLGTSMLASLEWTAAGDGRIKFVREVARNELAQFIEAHDVIVLPSLWENWPYVALQSLLHNRPVVATPTGGFTEIVQEGRSGWLTDGVGIEPLAATLDHVIGAREELAAMTGDTLPVRAALELTDDAPILERYSEMIASKATSRAAVRRSAAPLVTAIVPYYHLDRFVEETVASLFAQTYRRLEVIVVNDGSFREDDWILAELATRYPLAVLTQTNTGLGAARNFGISQSRGKYVFPLDADNIAEPTFVERCVELLERESSAPYVTSWSRYIDDLGRPLPAPQLGYQPIGNWSRYVDVDNVAGDAAALLRRRIFELGHWYDEELTSFEDWMLYRELHHAGHYGIVIPERLIRYRVREDSMIRETGLPNAARLAGELQARVLERGMTWTYTSD
jgi:glycogen(starch) synthase